MNSQTEDVPHRLLLLIRIDANRLFDRIKNRSSEYMSMFAIKRSRAHFPAIFEHKYSQVDINDLKHFSEEIIIAIDNFYSQADEVYWYVKQTEDMPRTLEGKLGLYIRELGSLIDILNLHIDAELGYANEDES